MAELEFKSEELLISTFAGTGTPQQSTPIEVSSSGELGLVLPNAQLVYNGSKVLTANGNLSNNKLRRQVKNYISISASMNVYATVEWHSSLINVDTSAGNVQLAISGSTPGFHFWVRKTSSDSNYITFVGEDSLTRVQISSSIQDGFPNNVVPKLDKKNSLVYVECWGLSALYAGEPEGLQRYLVTVGGGDFVI